MLEFLIRIEGQPERTVAVDGDVVFAGSDAGSHLLLPHAAACHFEISVRSVGVVLRALDADAETRVNGAGATQLRLSVGDVIEAGGAQVIFSRHGPGRSAEPVPEAAATPARHPPPAGAEPRPRPARRRSQSLAPIAILLCLALVAGAVLYLRSRAAEPVIPVTLRLPGSGGAADGEAVPGSPGRTSAKTERRPWLEPTAEIDPEPAATPEPGIGEAAPAGEDLPDPASAPPLPDPAELERRERRKLEAEARERFAGFMTLLPDRISRYTFDGPIADLTAIADALPLGALRDEVRVRLGDLLAAQRVFERAKHLISSGEHTRLTLASGLELVVTDADETGFTARVGPATTRKKWTELRPATLHDVISGRSSGVADWMDAAAFAALFGEQEAAEIDLLEAFGLDEARLPDIAVALARYRGIDLPPGGFVLHDDQWVTAEEKGFLERGLVQHDGKWMTKEEALAAQGYVQHEGRWLSPRDYEKVLEEIAEAEALAKKYLPKGFIDQAGHGSEVPWDQRIELKTRHYRIETNLDRETARDIAYTMEVLRMNLASVFGLRGKGARFTVNVVASREQYRANWRAAGMSLGFCSGSEICTFYQPPMTTSVLMHEGTHQMLRRFAPSCPRWMHEGMATYFECSKFDFDPKQKRVNLRVGLLNAMRLASFQAEHQAGRSVPLETFITGGGGNPYTQGWALVYYLAKGRDGEYGPRLHTFVAEAHQTDVIDRFKKIFKIRDLKKFEQEWLDYILALNPADGVRLAGEHQ